MAVNVATSYKFKSVGSSREQRFQISGQGRIFDFGRYCDGILRKFSEFDLIADNDEALFPKFCETMDYMREEVGNVGHITALKFMQLSSLIGLLPLRVSTFAEVKGGAPKKYWEWFMGNPQNVSWSWSTSFVSFGAIGSLQHISKISYVNYIVR